MKFLIIGGGISGPATALFLARAGHTVEVFDRVLDMQDVGAGVTLMENGLRVLRRLGILDEVVRAGNPCEFVELRTFDGGRRRGRRRRRRQGVDDDEEYEDHYDEEPDENGDGDEGDVVARFAIARRDGLTPVNVLRTALTRALSRALTAAGVFFHHDKQLTGIAAVPPAARRPSNNNGGGVRALFQDGTWADGDVLVGADGIHSAVRGAVFPGCAGPAPSGYVGYLGVSPFDPGYGWPSSRGLHYFTDCTAGAGRSGLLMRASETHCHWAVYESCAGGGGGGGSGSSTHSGGSSSNNSGGGHSPTLRHDEWRPFGDVAAERRRVAAVAAGWGYPPAFEPTIASSQRVVPVTVYDMPALPSWHNGRDVVLVGDAKHAVLPFVGQGTSVALEDADVLCALLEELLPRGIAPAVAFRMYQGLRERRVRMIAEASRVQARRQHATTAVGAKVGRWSLRLAAFHAALTGGSLNSDEVLAYDGREVVQKMLRRKGYI
ncbi:hypothetical protein DFJ73DRAFT_927831 [Zopfochytrium polystomum]|nr:hypothetical protein DFJ73DRAFT_927831 [Zopfochytrium polystomum]